MLAYYISQSNEYVFRTEPTASSAFTMSLQNMTTQYNLTASISGLTYQPYESFVSFSINNISGAMVGDEYRAVLYNGIASGSVDIWHGSIQVYASQSIDKAVYENQNTQYISNQSENLYIIMD
jgi:hypothetical protein